MNGFLRVIFHNKRQKKIKDTYIHCADVHTAKLLEKKSVTINKIKYTISYVEIMDEKQMKEIAKTFQIPFTNAELNEIEPKLNRMLFTTLKNKLKKELS
jgi:hypothetical protein